MADPTQLVGGTFAGCTVQRLLGRGGMGAVYLALTGCGEPRALKFLAPELAQQPDLRARFEREGRAMEKIPPHPNVVRVFGVYEDDLLEQPFIVMEFLEGRSLLELLRERGPLPSVDLVRVARGAASGLAALHRCGLIHRDVKPGNLLALSNGGIKVVDLGLAKDLFLSGLTEPGRALGTIHTMAPEQWEGGTANEATDVFGLGATLYHLLTGVTPFGPDVAMVRDRCFAGNVDDVRVHAPGVPAWLAGVVLRMLRPEQRERYACMQDVLEDVERGALPEAGPQLIAVAPPNQRWSLADGRRFSIGSSADQAIRLEHPSVSPRHARISSKEIGMVLRDLRSRGGTWVGGEPVRDEPRVLADGVRITLGEVELVFQDPRSQRQAAYLADVERAACPVELVRALAALADPRVTAWCLERLTPDPIPRARGQRALAHLLGPEAPQAEAEASLAEESGQAELLAQLRAIAGADFGGEASAWLAWWCRVRLEHPVQLAPPSPERGLTLHTASGAVPCGDVTLIGRDPKCHVVVQGGAVARLHAKIIRLHRRLIARLEAGGHSAFLDPGAPRSLGGPTLELRVDEQRVGDRTEIDRHRFAALAKRGHPATATALLSVIEGLGRDWGPQAAALFPLDDGVAAKVGVLAAEHARQAGARAGAGLSQMFGGGDLARWRAGAARDDLGPQVVPTD